MVFIFGGPYHFWRRSNVIGAELVEARLSLSYLVFEVRKPARWARFLGHTLGLAPAEPAPACPGSAGRTKPAVQGWRLDDKCHRLLVAAGPQDDLAAIGLDCGDAAHLAASVQRLRRHGVDVQPADAALCRARRVEQLMLAHDPAGNVIELHIGLMPAAQAFSSSIVAGGFHTGEHGMGHAALVARDLAAMERFYVQALGFGVTERLNTRTGPLDVAGLFLHCNRRHHSIALLQLPLAQRMHHFMLQTRRLADVGAAYERVQQHKMGMSLQIGQHPDPDGTFSFYAPTPSGFDFEIGHGSHEIDPATWREMPSSITSTWGHQPSARLQWKMARALVGQWVRSW
jgi:biphenyl-2,3-diol 1,2-dioxygenase